jgi:heme oxygenase
LLADSYVAVVNLDTVTTASFSSELRAATWSHHERAAESTFLQALVAGRLDRLGYADMVGQHYFIYRVLEEAAGAMSANRVVNGLMSPSLTRLPAIEMDLCALLGDDWAQRVRPNVATEAYCERLHETCFTWPGGFVAHHYTRYLGDLSGGQYLRHRVAQALQLPGDVGTRFYVFDGIADVEGFKLAYRRRLDAMSWDEAERTAIVNEVTLAYRLNINVLTELSRTHASS